MRSIGFTARVFFCERAEFLRQQIFAGDVAAADPKLAAQGAVELLDRGHRFPLESKQFLSPFGEHQPQRREANFTRYAIEQLAATVVSSSCTWALTVGWRRDSNSAACEKLFSSATQ